MLNSNVGLTNVIYSVLILRHPLLVLRLIQLPGASSLSHIWLTTMDIKELLNGRDNWPHLFYSVLYQHLSGAS